MLPMRVCGPPRLPYTRLGFSPHAILRPYLAPGNFMPWTVRAGTTLRIALRPPKRLPDPGSTWSVVTPPARLRGNCGSCGQIECSAQTYGVAGFTSSLPSLLDSTAGAGYTPRCECTSTIPGVTNLPWPSITTGDSPPSACLIAGSSALLPTAAILLSFMSNAPFTIRGPTAVKMVTFSMSVGFDAKGL